MSKQDLTKRAIKAVIANRRATGADDSAILGYLDSILPLWAHDPHVSTTITRLKSDVTRVTQKRSARV